MNKILSNSLFHVDINRFNKIRDEAKSFNTLNNGSNIIQDDIFNVIKNYGRRAEQPIEILRYPIKDKDFCACTFLRKGVLFIVCNTFLPLSKQIFAAAHELYHIIKYVNGDDDNYVSHGSILKSKDIDETEVAAEDREANAFAGLFLAPTNFLNEQIDIYSIKAPKLQVKGILRLMDIFAIPYKAMVLRLYEEKLIDEVKADELLSVENSEIDKVVELTGVAARWQKVDLTIIDFGSLMEYLSINEKYGFATESRLDNDKKTLESLIAEIKK